MADERRVEVISPDGQRGSVPEAQVQAVIDAGGSLPEKEGPGLGTALATAAGGYLGAITAPISPLNAAAKGISRAVVTAVAPEAAARLAKKEAEARARGDMGMELADSMDAVGQGYSQGITAGLGAGATRQALDLVSPEAGKAYEQWDDATRGEHPYLAKGAELVGMIGTTLATGGAGGAARLAPTAAIARVGVGAENLAVRATAGLGTGALSRALGAGARMGAQGAAEGAIYGGTEYVGEAMLHDHELAAEKLVAAVGNGALWGGVGGGALGGGASLAKSGVGAALGGIARRVAGEGAAIEGGVVAKLKDAAGDEMWRAINGGSMLSGGKKWTAKAAQIEGGASAIGNEVLDRLGTQLKGKRVDELAPMISGELDKVGQQIGDIVGNSKAVVDLEAVYRGSVSDARKALEKEVTGQKAIGAFDEAWDLVQKTLTARGSFVPGGVAVPELVAVRRQLDNLIHQSRGAVISDAQKAMMSFRNSLEDAAINAMEKEANDAGGTIVKEFGELKGSYRKLALARDAAEDNAVRFGTNRQMGLTDYLSGGVGAQAGAFIGSVAGPAGSAVGGFVGGVAGTAINKLVRERGNSTAAVFLRRLSDSTEVARALRHVDVALDSAAKGLLASPTKALPSGKGRYVAQAVAATSPRERARPHIERVSELQGDPMAYAERVANDVKPLAGWAPNVAGQYVTKATSAAAFLASKSPTSFSREAMVRATPGGDVSDRDAYKFLRYQRAVDDPMSVLSDMKKGVITAEAVEALRATSPRLYSELRTRTFDVLAERMAEGRPIPYAQRISLSLLFDVPGDRSLTPSFMMALQANTNAATPTDGGASGGGAPPMAKGGPPKRPLELPKMAAGWDRIESGRKGRG